jgi:hypothetical protein
MESLVQQWLVVLACRLADAPCVSRVGLVLAKVARGSYWSGGLHRVYIGGPPLQKETI